MDLTLSEEQTLLVTTVRRFVRKEIWLWEKRIDTNAAALPPDVFRDLHARVRDMGLDHVSAPPGRAPAGIAVPDLGLLTGALIAEQISQHRAGVLAPGYGLFGVDVPVQLYAATSGQAVRFLAPLLRREATAFAELDPPVPAGPTDHVRTRARWLGQEWMLDGTKIMVAGAADAAFGLVFANTEDEAGRRTGVGCFIVEAARTGFQRWRPYPTLAVGRDTLELNFSNLRLPPDNRLDTPEAPGARFAADLQERRLVFEAAHLTGVGAAAQDLARLGAAARRAFGRPLSTSDAVRLALADNEADVCAARLLTLATAAGAALRPAAGETAGDGPSAAALARFSAADAAARVVDRTMQIHGVHGASTDLPLERWYRELRLRRLEAGGDAWLRGRVGEHLLTTFHK